MLNYRADVSLKPFNTLALTSTAKVFVEVSSEAQLLSALDYAEQNSLEIIVLSGGSNVIFAKDFAGLVIHIAIPGVTIKQHNDEVLVTAGAGENWHQLAMDCLNQDISGLQNLVLIPGCVGAAPIQNIGAYGVELKDIFHSLKGWDRLERCWKKLYRDDCCFGYRDSIFKGSLKDRFIITEVTLKLSRNDTVNIDYGILGNYLRERGISHAKPIEVAKAVIAIRSSKLPDPAKLANAGSFFKNPVVTKQLFAKLIEQYPSMPNYPAADQQVKLAAGWLLEEAGWKGYRQNDCGMHRDQALVLVNYGNATGEQVIDLARTIQRNIADKFSVHLEVEPRVY
mgnify:CR=1 FL=1